MAVAVGPQFVVLLGDAARIGRCPNVVFRIDWGVVWVGIQVFQKHTES